MKREWAWVVQYSVRQELLRIRGYVTVEVTRDGEALMLRESGVK